MEIVVKQGGISPYTICFLAAFLLDYLYVAYELRRTGVPRKHILYSFMLNTVLILYGGINYTTITEIIAKRQVERVGFSGLGGVIGMVLGVVVFGWISREHRDDIRRTYIVSLGLMYSVSKLGCFLVGCCYGVPYEGFGSVTYIKEGMEPIGRVPVQLLEVILFAVLFMLVHFYGKKHKDKAIIASFMVYSLGKFSLDYLREYTSRPVFSHNQLVCIVIFLLGIGLLIYQTVDKKDLAKLQ